MNDPGRQAHWEHVYATKDATAVSWFEENPAVSLELIRASGVDADAGIIDIGGGASRLVDALIGKGFKHLTVLDLSDKALAAARARLGARASEVGWIVADVTQWQPAQEYDVWHDRAAFHFLTEPGERAAYAACLHKAVRPGAYVIIGTFALDGPERCSGLPVMRHDAASLGAMLGPSFALMETRSHVHHTPMGAIQRFQFSLFKRSG